MINERSWEVHRGVVRTTQDGREAAAGEQIHRMEMIGNVAGAARQVWKPTQE